MNSRPEVRNCESGTLGAAPLSPLRVFEGLSVEEARKCIGDSNMTDVEVLAARDACAALAQLIIKKWKKEQDI
ncbi:MAG: hypothetical protein WAZ27_05160 [Minisyncoccia bacterium]